MTSQKQFEEQQKTVQALQKQTERGETYNRISVGLLGGIKSGLHAATTAIAAGGDKEQVMEMGKRGLIGGVVKDLSASFGGTANEEFLQSMNVMSMLMGGGAPQYQGNVKDIMNKALQRTEATFSSEGYGLQGAAKGRVFSSPHLAMVGEGSQNEVVIPTERIRKGLPVNPGVMKELASIGVPGYEEGKPGVFGRAKGALGEGLKDEWKGGVATMGLSFAQTYMKTGDIGYAAGQAMGAGIGMGASMAIGLIPGVGPFIGPILGPLIGAWVGGKIGGALAYKPRHGKYRKRAIKNLEQHVLTQGIFDFGQPGGIKGQLSKAIAGGKEKHPSQEHFDKLLSGVGQSKVLKYGFRSGRVSPELLVGLLSGNVPGTADQNRAYSQLNAAFYGGTRMAKGGIVTKPTNAVIGEAGPEAVIPLGQHGGYASRQQQDDQKNIITELRKQNQQMGMFIKNMGDSKTVLNVDGRQLAEAVGQGMYDINST